MQVQETELRLLEEELREFWPEWHVVRRIHEGGFAKVYEIRKEEHGLDFSAALKVIRHIGEELTLPTLSAPGGEELPGGGYGASTLKAGGPRLIQDESQTTLQMDTGGDEQMPDVFRNEIRIMNVLRGAPNVVNMEGVHYQKKGREHTLYIRMELLTSLAGLMGAGKAFSLSEILRIGQDVCRALACCEERQIIHRDIKPGNLFLDRYGTCKVGDFGASRKLETVHVARVMTGIGTISYMAPEIYRGEAYNNTVDLYSLGLVLYQLLNDGRMPFMQSHPRDLNTSDIDESNYQRLHGREIPPLFAGKAGQGAQAKPPLAGVLDAIIRRACAYRPEDRYQTAADLYEALKEYSGSIDQAEALQKTVPLAGIAGHRQGSLNPAPPLPEEPDRGAGGSPSRISDREAAPAAGISGREEGEPPASPPSGGQKGGGRAGGKDLSVYIFAASVLAAAAVLLLLLRGLPGGNKSSGTEPESGSVAAADSDTGSEEAADREAEPQTDASAEDESDANPAGLSESESGKESGAVQEASEAEGDQTEQAEEESPAETGAGTQTDPEPEPEPEASLWPDDALEYNGHHYYIYDDGKISWEEAVQRCLDRGGYPAVINDDIENEMLYSYMRESGYDTAFFGLTLMEDGQWGYSYGDTSDYRDWGINSKGVEEPNNSGGKETNVELDVHMVERGYWNDAAFGAQVRTPEGEKYKDRYSYICEWSE